MNKGPKGNIICPISEYGRHTAQHPAAVIANNNKCSDPLRAKKYLSDIEPYRRFGYSSLISDPLNLSKGAMGKN